MTPGTPELRALWTLDPTVTFLNHGSFGATPRPVLDAQARYRDAMEREPVAFLGRRLEGLGAAVRARLATYLGAEPAGVLPVANATAGINAVFRSIDWAAGDELLLADQAYNAVKQAARYLADRHGVRVVEAKVPFPLANAGEVVAAFAAGLSPRTKLVVIDHIASPTALILPVAEVKAMARAAGVPVLIDGAHGPGLLPLALDALGADFYVGNLHKWVCAPKGAGFLYCAAAWRARVHPLAISHGYGMGAAVEFDWTGTDDPTPWLCVPEALAFWERLGETEVRAARHALVREGRRLVAEALGADLPHPDDPALYGAMAAIPVPWAGPASAPYCQALTARLYAEHQIEVPFMGYDERVLVRISGQVYNAPEDYVRLAEALRTFRG